MNGNLNFSVLPNSQQQFVQAVVGLPQQQQFIPVQNGVPFNLGNGVFPVQNLQQGIEMGSQQIQPLTNGQTYTCINQNGMTYLAVTPPQPQCYQAIQTPQGLQLVQVIPNPVNFNPFCVQNGPQAQGFFSPFNNQQNGQALQPMQAVPSVFESQQQFSMQQPTNQNVEYKQEDSKPEEESIADDNQQDGSAEDSQGEFEIIEEISIGEISDDEAENSNLNPEPVSNEIASMADPLAALTSLTSSIPTFTSNTSQQGADQSVFNGNNSITHAPTSSEQQPASLILGDQQFPPNTRAFQVLVPTPQGMAIQTVVASYPSPPPMVNSMSSNNSFMNLDQLDTTLTPQLVDLPLQQQIHINSIPPQSCNTVASMLQSTISSTDLSSGGAVTVSAPVTVTRTTSPCHSTTAAIYQKSISPAPTVRLTEIAVPVVPTPTGSPHYLPDSTDDLYQPTIKQSTLNVVDGINLEEIREFARSFKMRRLVLGLTQTQVGQALSATEGPAYSQSAICRFEKLDITPRSALKIRPILEKWLRDAEEKQQQGGPVPAPPTNGLEYLICSNTSAGKIRKRRTFFSAEALVILTAYFEKSAHPTGREINAIATEIGYDRDVVRVWFCNKRQSLRNSITPQRGRISNKTTSSPSP